MVIVVREPAPGLRGGLRRNLSLVLSEGSCLAEGQEWPGFIYRTFIMWICQPYCYKNTGTRTHIYILCDSVQTSIRIA